MYRLEIENFRNISDRLVIDLANITILTGTNNSGKSNILKLLIVLDDYFASDNHFNLSFYGPSAGKHKINCYQNAINSTNWDKNKNLKISYERKNYIMTFEFAPVRTKSARQQAEEIQEGRLVYFEIFSTETKSKIWIKNLSDDEYELNADQSFIRSLSSVTEQNFEDRLSQLLANEASIQSRLNDLISQNKTAEEGSEEYNKTINGIYDANWRLGNIRKWIEDLKKFDANRPPVGISFKIVFSIKENSQLKSFTLPDLIKDVLSTYLNNEKEVMSGDPIIQSWKSELHGLFTVIKRSVHISTRHLSADRSHQSRIYLQSDKTSELSEIISLMEKSSFKKGGEGDKFIKKWMSKFKIGTDYRFRSIEGIATAIEVNGDEGWINLVDKGFGAGQVLPIILRVGEYLERHTITPPPKGKIKYVKQETRPPILIFEEPEANLHPAFQSLLAEMFHEAAKDVVIRIIIETHSEYLLRKFKLLKAQNKLRENEVLIYYVNQGDSSVEHSKQKIQKIEILDNGKLSHSFGKGFFDEADEIEMDLYRINKKAK